MIAAFALGWNVYRDVLLKARVVVHFSVSHIVQRGMQGKLTRFVLGVTNHGPGTVHLNVIVLKNAPLWRRLIRKVQQAVTFHDLDDPLSGRLPAKLEVGEGISLLFPYDKKCGESFSKPFTHIGITDSFGRIHWAPSSNFRKVQQTYRKDFKS